MKIKSAVIVKNENMFLLVQEKRSLRNGFWNWSQGGVENGETFEQAAIREVKEETGLDIKIERKLAVLMNTFRDTKEIHVYLGNVVGGKIDFPNDEIMDVRYFTFEQINNMKDQLVGEWVFKLISQNK